MKNILPLLISAAILCGLCSCSQTIPPTPPDTLTSQRVINTYQKALTGDAESLYYVGLFYLTGKNGFPQDNRLGANALEMAAKAGHQEAMIFIGKCYEAGLGRFDNDSMALYYYKKAADSGYADGKKHYQRLSEILRQEEAAARARAQQNWNQAASEYNRIMGSSGFVTMPYMD